MTTATADTEAQDDIDIESPLARLTDEQIEQLGKEFDAIHDEVFNDLGARDAKYIHSMIEMHRRLVLMARAALVPSRFKPAWIFGSRIQSHWPCRTLWPISMFSSTLPSASSVVPPISAGR